MASPELACTYAGLILHDEGVAITADQIKRILDTANVKVEGYWIDMFAEYFKNHDIGELVRSTSVSGSGSASAPAAAATEAAPVEEKKEEKKEEEAETMVGGFDDLFG